MAQSSKIFLKNRALGYVSNDVPLVVRYITNQKENLVVTCVGKSFHTYGCSSLKLLSVSGAHPEDITCLAADTYHIFTASDNVIRAWRRGTDIKFTYSGHTTPVHIMLSFGPHLISVDEDSNLKLWDITAEEVYLELTFNNSTFEISTVLHPTTYLNKILLGSTQGTMQLWNVLTSTLVYSFKTWGAAITVLEQAPAVDVAAIGLANGKIILHNLKFDKTIMEFVQDWGLVTSLSFRTDGHPILASGTLSGHIVFWDLEERKVMSQLLAAHDGSVTGLQCLPNEPLMVTSSADNSLRMWIFDMPDGGARLLNFRAGHNAPPTRLRFYGELGHDILSSGLDSSLRIFSTKTEMFNKSLGKASYNRKASKRLNRTVEDHNQMPPILHFTSETTREKEWNNIAAIHSGIPLVTTWSFDKAKMGEIRFLPERFAEVNPKSSGMKKMKELHKIEEVKKTEKFLRAHATSVCLTNCGNFVVIGYSSGHVDRFNVQSGIHRETYGQKTAHNGPVRGVMTDGLNKLTITGGKDAVAKFWRFKSGGAQPLTVLELGEPVSFFCSHRDSSIVAIALEDFSVTVVDIDTRQVIRKFKGHKSQLTDAAFSPDSRWLITSSMDSTIRTWDIPTGQLIDCFRVDSACTSLTFSATGDMLATSHVDYLGIALWANRTLFTLVSLRPINETDEHPLVTLPSSLEDDCQGLPVEVEEQGDLEDATFKSPEQISIELITLSSAANSRWQNLLNIDLVRQRNKPRAGLKVPKAAPFFLPTLQSLELEFDLSAENDGKEFSTDLLATFNSLTAFGKLLSKAQEPELLVDAFEKLKSLGPSAINQEISNLSIINDERIKLMNNFMKMIELVLNSNKDFELAQAYLGLFLKKHGDFITNSKVLRNYLKIIQKCQISGWEKLQDNLLFNLCVVDALKNA